MLTFNYVAHLNPTQPNPWDAEPDPTYTPCGCVPECRPGAMPIIPTAT